MKCKKHPKYKGKLKPRVSCLTCWATYLGISESCLSCGCNFPEGEDK